MLRQTNIRNQNIVIGILLTISIYLEMTFLQLDNHSYTVFLSTGLITGFFISFGKDILPSIIISSIFSRFVFGLVFFDFTLGIAILNTISLLTYGLITIFVFDFFIRKLNCKFPNTPKNVLRYSLSVAITLIIASLLPAFQLALFEESNFFTELHSIIKPNAISLLVIATTIILSNEYDNHFGEFSKRTISYVLYGIFFTVVSYLIFSNSSVQLTFGIFEAVFLFLFLINGYYYSYRMLIFISYVYILLYNYTIVDLSFADKISRVSEYNSFLLVLIIMTLFFKLLIGILHENNRNLNETNKRFEDMLESTVGLLNVQSFIDNTDDSFQEEYLIKIFNIALKIFDKVDAGFVVLYKNNKLDVLDSKRYEIEFIKSWKINPNKIVWTIEGPAHVKNQNEYYKSVIGENYDLLKEKLPELTESIRFVIRVGDNQYGGITFDLINNHFTKTDINNVTSFQKLINSFYERNELTLRNNTLKDDIVLSLIRTLELYDQYTGGHSEDVAEISKELATRLNLSEHAIYDIYWAGIVHDIGKIGIPQEVINKPSRLTVSEYEEIKKHPIYGYDILKRSKDLHRIATLVKHHHEWWNGSGYPDGLQEDEIPLGAQILQVADSVSSMATVRPYSRVKTNQEIIKELKLYSGTQFNEEIASVMIELIKEGFIKKYSGERVKR